MPLAKEPCKPSVVEALGGAEFEVVCAFADKAKLHHNKAMQATNSTPSRKGLRFEDGMQRNTVTMR
jgi:hypothetical protein